jgi:hypothetical protein
VSTPPPRAELSGVSTLPHARSRETVGE